MKTFNRGRLLRLARAGKLLLVGTGSGGPVPVVLPGPGETAVPGRPDVTAEDFSCRGGSAKVNATGTVTLTVPRHSGEVTFEFQIAGETRRSADTKPDPAPRFTHGQPVKSKAGRPAGIWLRSWVDGGTVKHLVSQVPKGKQTGKEVVYEDSELLPG